MSALPVYAVIMAGGSGTRFWPASRSARPKQFLAISGEHAMLRETFRRIEPMTPRERVLVVTAASQADLVRACLPELPRENLLAEPQARNTAPCVAWAAAEIRRRAPESIQIVLPADHVIEPAERFRATLAAAASEAASADVLLTLGIRPRSAHTGYGYIEAGEEVARRNGVAVHAVRRFVEKPDAARAEQFLARGNFLWNAGIFVWSTPSIHAALERHAPELSQGFERVLAGRAPLAEVYPTLPAQPIDVALMEKAKNVRVLPVDYAWNDVGSWAALPEVHAVDEHENCTVVTDGARAVSLDSERCITYVEGGRIVALLGVADLVVVQTADATLVCSRDRAQDVKRIVERLEGEAPEFL